MASFGQVLTWLLVRLVSLVISLMVLANLAWRRFWSGPEFFHVKPRPVPPPILTHPKWGTHSYMTLKSQGIKLHYVEAGDRNNPLIVFIHGFPDCWFSWRHQLEYFSQKYWVVAMDLRGYGDSDKPSGTCNYSKELLVQDIRHFILEFGKERCTLVGHDWGAALAWQLVVMYPEMFDFHVSCNGPHPNVFMKHIKSSVRQLFMSWYIFFFQTPWVPELALQTEDLSMFDKMFRGHINNVDACPDDVIEAYKYYFSQKGALTPPLNYYRNVPFGDPPQQLPKVQVPTLIVWGTEDMALTKILATLAVDECESAEVKFVEGAGHWVQQEQPNVVNSLIHKFLDSDLTPLEAE